jgi:FixJ family two-component response regulator
MRLTGFRGSRRLAMETTEISVFIVEDDAAAREGLRDLVESVGLETRAFSSAEEFLGSYNEEWCGCLLLDVRMPGMSGLKLQDELNRRGSKLSILFLTGHGDVAMAVETLKKGALDFVEKPAGGQHLLDKVYDAIKESTRLRQKEVVAEGIRSKLGLLTSREREVLDRVKAGKQPKLIARELGLSRKTVDWHLSVIRQKMGVESSSKLMLLLHRTDQS